MSFLRIKLSQNDQKAAWTGLGAAAATAAVIGTGGAAAFASPWALPLIGAAAVGAGGASKAESTQQDNVIAGAKNDAEKARRDSIIREYGAKQQADAQALATSRRNSSPSGGQTPGGFIGAGMNTAGTF